MSTFRLLFVVTGAGAQIQLFGENTTSNAELNIRAQKGLTFLIISK